MWPSRTSTTRGRRTQARSAEYATSPRAPSLRPPGRTKTRRQGAPPKDQPKLAAQVWGRPGGAFSSARANQHSAFSSARALRHSEDFGAGRGDDQGVLELGRPLLVLGGDGPVVGPDVVVDRAEGDHRLDREGHALLDHRLDRGLLVV